VADTPESLIDDFKAAFLTADVGAMADCYEDDAILVMAGLGIVAEGKEAIRDTWAGMTAMGQPIDFKIASRPVRVDGDLAYAHLTGTALIKSSETGQEDTMDIRATEVMHRGVDGKWRYVIDHA